MPNMYTPHRNMHMNGLDELLIFLASNEEEVRNFNTEGVLCIHVTANCACACSYVQTRMCHHRYAYLHTLAHTQNGITLAGIPLGCHTHVSGPVVQPAYVSQLWPCEFHSPAYVCVSLFPTRAAVLMCELLWLDLFWSDLLLTITIS